VHAVTLGIEITRQLAEQHLDALTDIVARAAAVTLATSFSSVARSTKADMSPVTAADEASEALIIAGLAELLPGVPVIAEEESAAGSPPPSNRALSSSIRSMARGNFSPAATNSPSISASSPMACRSPA
jgi:hypothetical protein